MFALWHLWEIREALPESSIATPCGLFNLRTRAVTVPLLRSKRARDVPNVTDAVEPLLSTVSAGVMSPTMAGGAAFNSAFCCRKVSISGISVKSVGTRAGSTKLIRTAGSQINSIQRREKVAWPNYCCP
jgi:hypothetical protein